MTRKRRPKEEYYTLYGSTDDGAITNVVSETPASPLAGNTTDDGSLVGESLIPTDNEDEGMPLNSAEDRPHVLLMSGDEIKPLVGSSSNGYLSSLNSNGGHRSNRGLCHRFFYALGSFKERHPIVHISLLGLTLAVVLFVCSVIFFPDSGLAFVATTPESQLTYKIPFPVVDRQHHNDPVSNFIVKDLFDQSLFYQGRDQNRYFKFPFPTGAFWTNLVMPATTQEEFSFPIAVYPYAVKWSGNLLQASYPAAHRKELPREIHDYFYPDLTFSVMEANGQRFVRKFDALSVTLRFHANTPGGFWEIPLVQGSPYITIQYKNASPTVRALSTFKDVFCPRDEDATNFSFDSDSSTRQRRRRRLDLSFGVCSDKSNPDSDTTVLRGVQFMVQTQEDMFWFVFASEPITLTFDTRMRTEIESLQRFTGILRFAVIPPPSTTNKSSNNDTSAYLKIPESKGLQRLIYHAGVYPTGGSVSWNFRPAAAMDATKMLLRSVTGMTSLSTPSASSVSPAASSSTTLSSTKNPRVGAIRFDFNTQTFAPTTSATGSKALLMLALPHHSQLLAQDTQLGPSKFNLVYKSIKGPMTPVMGSSWTYDEVLPSLGFDGDSGSNSGQPLQDVMVRGTIIKSLEEDIKLSLPTKSENIYGFGKQTARLAQLAHIAYTLQQHTYSSINSSNTTKEGDKLSQILSQALDLLGSSLESLLTNAVSDALLYDGNLGGLVTSDGLYDKGADFGNGRYNDHHFHYGYLLYASAIMGRRNSTFVEKFGSFVDGIYYDIAHNNNFASSQVDGVFFPGARHKSWFDGHSFASGLFPAANGKSQESSSEAVNAYYGAYLWSLVRHEGGSDPALDTSAQTDFARLLLATEIRGAQTYWHMSPSNDTILSRNNSLLVSPFSDEFAKNYMVGNLGMMDAVCSTWFGTDPVYVHLINFLPLTSATGELFRRIYVEKELANALRQSSKIEMAWRGYAIADAAIVDPTSAWNDAQDLISSELDSGLSKSQLLYWIATRDSFSPSSIATDSTATGVPSAEKSSKNSSSSSGGSCQTNSGCASTGLTGDCCPTSDGKYLDCCGSS